MVSTESPPIGGDTESYSVTVLEAASKLGMWPQSVRFMIADGRLRALWSPDGKRYLIHSGDLDRYTHNKGGKKSDGLRGVKVAEGADRDGKYTHTERVREILKEIGMPVQGFADAMGVDVSLFYRIEQGTRNASAEYRAKAAALLDHPEAELFRKIDPNNP